MKNEERRTRSPDKLQGHPFLKVPKEFFSDGKYLKMSIEGKILYSLIADRMNLSEENGFKDELDKTFVYYTNSQIRHDLQCGHDKATKVLRELEEFGLITRKKQKLSKADKIYLNHPDFMCGNSALQNAEKSHQEVLKSRLLECGKSASNKTDMNNTNYSNINLSIDSDVMDEIIRENISYDALLVDEDEKLVNEIFSLIREVMSDTNETIRIGKQEMQTRTVKSRFMELEFAHIKYVLRCIRENTTDIKNIRNYLLTALYNSPSTMYFHVQSEVNHDFPQYVHKTE